MVHKQISIYIFISKASVGSTCKVLARLKTTDGNGYKQSLADLLKTTWEAVLSKAETTRRPTSSRQPQSTGLLFR